MEQHQQHQPRLCQETEMMKVVRPGPTDSPPPNCAICLGICTNKCFTDCCLHQFCFSCLLEWSKIKAECPLCKQPFKSIIYNIKSNLEYEEHIITNPERDVQGEDLLLDEDIDVRTEYLFLPNGPRPQRHFQYRTTFTLEPGGEFAIQQLLLSHPRTNSIYLHSDRYLHHRLNQHSIHQRRNIYSESLWVDPQPDITGRYRECSPSFFRENPAQIHRIVPWLNRELSALLVDYVDIYQVQEQIMEMLCQYSIQSSSFRSRIVTYLGNRTDHFVHEFYNFVRSPYDMIGYDRHATYSSVPPAVYSQSVSDDDSDVRVVDSPSNDDCIYVPPRTPEVIVINSESSSDSDVVIRFPSPPTIPTIVNLVDTDSDDNTNVPNRQPVVENNERTETNNRSPQLPIKIRYKRNRNSAEIVNKKHKEKKNGRKWYDTSSDSYVDSDYSDQPKSESEFSTAHITTSSSSSSSESSSSSSSSANNKKYVQSLILKRVKSKSRKRKSSYYKTSKYRNKKSSNSNREESPERKYRIKRKKSKSKKTKRKSNDSGHHNHTRCKRMKKIKVERPFSSQTERDTEDSSSDDNEVFYRAKKRTRYSVKEERVHPQNEMLETKQEPENEPPENNFRPEPDASEHSDYGGHRNLLDEDVAGPSHGPSLRSVIVRGNNKWYSRPELEDTTTDNNSD